MRYTRNLKPFTGRMELAPFAGVLFLLVLFLLLQTSLAPAPGLRLQLPAVDLPEPPAGAGPTLVVAVDQRGQVYFDHQAIADDTLRERLAARVRAGGVPLSLLIQADETVKHAVIVRLAALARAAGIQEVVIGTRPPLFPADPGASPRPR